MAQPPKPRSPLAERKATAIVECLDLFAAEVRLAVAAGDDVRLRGVLFHRLSELFDAGAAAGFDLEIALDGCQKTVERLKAVNRAQARRISRARGSRFDP